VNPSVRPVEGLFYRCVSRKRDPLNAEGARLRGGRYNRPGEPALYLAEDAQAAGSHPEGTRCAGNRRAASRLTVVGMDDHFGED